jgi:hypothetical protein
VILAATHIWINAGHGRPFMPRGGKPATADERESRHCSVVGIRRIDLMATTTLMLSMRRARTPLPTAALNLVLFAA